MILFKFFIFLFWFNDYSINCIRLNEQNLETLTKGHAAQLDLSEKQIESIEPYVFNKTPKVSSISIHNNNLTRIEKGVFNNLKELRKINLNRNQIKSIDPGAFSQLLKLEELNLRSNQLTQIV